MRVSVLLFIYSLFFVAAFAGKRDSLILQKDDRMVFLFQITDGEIDSTYLSNKEQLKRIREVLSEIQNNPNIVLDSLRINATASPDGPVSINRALSKARGETLKRYLLGQFADLADFPIGVEQKTENWDGLLQAVRADSAVPTRRQVLDILNSSSSSARKKNELKALGQGKAYYYIRRNIMPLLRNTSVSIDWHSLVLGPEQTVLKQIPIPNPDTLALPAFQPAIGTSYYLAPGHRKFPFQLRTNLLSWAVLAPNVGIEFTFADRWSALLETGWTHWNWSDGKRRFRFRSLWPEVRYHFAANTTATRFWYVGMYLAEGQYNYHLGDGNGRQGHFWGMGLSGGYLLPLNKQFWMDFGISLGYTSDRYHIYRYQTDRDIWISTDSGNHFGPTKARVSLVWKFNQ